MVLSSLRRRCVSLPGLFGECKHEHQLAIKPQTKTTNLCCELAVRLQPSISNDTIHYTLVSSKASCFPSATFVQTDLISMIF